MRGGVFPENQVPPCDECMEADGHFCPGIIPIEDGKRHLCTACDDGVPCARAETLAPQITLGPFHGAEPVDKSEPEPEEVPQALADVPEASPAELIMEQHEERTSRASLRAAKALRGPGRTPRVTIRKRSAQEQAARENPVGQVLTRLRGELADLQARAHDTEQLIVLLERQSRRWENPRA